ncbi:MAG: hypothetical protein M8840_06595, partial [marine benthic group bacterium]|nr:hypothetical protein [Gemmatimonadota bacterium]
ELAGGESIPLDADRFSERPRRGASVRIPEIAKRAGPLIAVHPLRSRSTSGAGDEELPAEEISTRIDESDAETSGEAAVSAEQDGDSGPGQVELELEGGS